MAYVITDACTKDELCVEQCPTGCIHPTKDEQAFEEVPQLYIDPDECADCGVCVDVCPAEAIYSEDDLPAELSEFAQKNAAFFAAEPVAGAK